MADSRLMQSARGTDPRRYLHELRRAGASSETIRSEYLRLVGWDFRSLLIVSRSDVLALERHQKIRPVFFGGLSGPALSIQGSAFHYSTPRDVVPLEDYEAMEVAYLHVDHGLSSLPLDCPHREEHEWGSDDPSDEGLGNSTVYPYLEVKKIQDVFEWLVVLYGWPYVLDFCDDPHQGPPALLRGGTPLRSL